MCGRERGLGGIAGSSENKLRTAQHGAAVPDGMFVLRGFSRGFFLGVMVGKFFLDIA